jgi:hypothetical protein
MRDMCRLLVAYNDKYTVMGNRMRALRTATICFAICATLCAVASVPMLARLLWLL